MQCKLVVFAIIYCVSSVQVSKARKWDIINRIKRQQESPWSWGYVDVISSETNAPDERLLGTETTETNAEENPCLRPELTMPDFRTPDRSISETKCYEYIWHIKYREHLATKNSDCTQYRIKNRGPNGPYFAIGGRDALPGEFPHMAALGWKAAVGTWVFLCGGSLISPKFVLTAAHCTRTSPGQTTVADSIPKIVRLGDKNIIDDWANDVPPYDKNISRITVHPQYKSPKKYFDIALLELVSDVEFTKNAQPACLWRYFDTNDIGTKATLTGWGVIETAGRTTSPILQAAVVDFVDSQQCDELLRPMCGRNWCGIQDHQICAGKLAGGVDACQGDSGGPLQVKIDLPNSTQGAMHYVIGVTSFGFGCALENKPGVYTRVSSFVDWIESIVWS